MNHNPDFDSKRLLKESFASSAHLAVMNASMSICSCAHSMIELAYLFAFRLADAFSQFVSTTEENTEETETPDTLLRTSRRTVGH
eukprot:1152551-Pelagomonas_calceolata.AAC.2